MTETPKFKIKNISICAPGGPLCKFVLLIPSIGKITGLTLDLKRDGNLLIRTLKVKKGGVFLFREFEDEILTLFKDWKPGIISLPIEED